MPSLPQLGLSFSQTEWRQGWNWPNKKLGALREPTGALWGLLTPCRRMLVAMTIPSLTIPTQMGLKEPAQAYCQVP